MGVKRRFRPANPIHSTPYYIIVHLTIFLAETAIMGLMGWILSPDTQGQLTGGDDTTGNMPGYVFLIVSWSPTTPFSPGISFLHCNGHRLILS